MSLESAQKAGKQGAEDQPSSAGNGLSLHYKPQSNWLSRRHWPEIAILGIAVFLRLWLIEAKPPHYDEGINGWFADQMVEKGFYHYEPTNFHGPLHFYAVFLSQTLFGRHLWALRLPAIIASILCIWAVLKFRDYFGTQAARIAALAMAVSPAYVFYGRYSIHESWQSLFSILLLWGLLGLWKSGGRGHFFTSVLSFTGLVLTKETYVLHAGCIFLAGLVLWIWQMILPSSPSLPLARQRWSRRDAVLAIGLALGLVVFFYSGNFLDFASLKGLYQTFQAWFQTGTGASGHEKTAYQVGPLNYYWIMLMGRYEWPALSGLVACLRYVPTSDARLRYTAILAGGGLLAYTVIPYKTPWCIISIIWPFYLVLGALLGECAGRCNNKKLPWIIMTPLLLVSLTMCWNLNFRNFTNENEPYVYVQTSKEVSRITDPLTTIAAKDPRNHHLRGMVLLESYYPLPWMLGDFTRIGYPGKGQLPSDWDTDFIAVEKSRRGEIEKHLVQPYYRVDFQLRGSQEECTAYFSASLFSDYFGGTPEFQPDAPKP